MGHAVFAEWALLQDCGSNGTQHHLRDAGTFGHVRSTAKSCHYAAAPSKKPSDQAVKKDATRFWKATKWLSAPENKRVS